MQDLNDLYYFAQVVERGGFAAAGRALGVPKSKLSRRIGELEDRLGVRLLQRSTRRFAVTEVGQSYLRHVQAMIAEAAAAQEAIDRTRSEPRGQVRISCPNGLLDPLAPIVARFLVDYPSVQLTVERTGRPVDVIEEGFDLALRVRNEPLEDEGLVIRRMVRFDKRMVASPALLARAGTPLTPDDLQHFDGLDMSRQNGVHAWELRGPNNEERNVAFQPRLITDDFQTLHEAARAGVGIVQLPQLLVDRDLASGRLISLLPEWGTPTGILHAAFPTRRGLVPAVRVLLDRLAEGFAKCSEVEPLIRSAI
ncbi:LysR substrate-binding domain-containing protein [Roseiterribacter gracilis]|uniref:LysR family transcriptional regulator n=1 Tax=Roseiterribacter gracilis TaxID=2812848 RepID=A0A8S8XBQ5_9PROT|nr:LysR family transcriptional regulator [Rhodospirillales bacterium TMPK1]